MPNLTDGERRHIVDNLLRRSVDGVLPRGALSQEARKIKRTNPAIGKIWAHFCKTEAVNGCGEWRSQIAHNSGRKRHNREDARLQIRAVPLNDRRPIRRLVEASGVSTHVILLLLREGILKRKSGRLKPSLTDENKLKRLEYVLGFIDEDSLRFEPMDNVIHIDEKWLYDDIDKRSYLVFEDENVPQRGRRSKHFMPKTMFLAAVARTRYNRDGELVWNGKIGIWPLTEEYVALRRSRYRERGETCQRNIESVTRAVYKTFLLDDVIPATKANWPRREKWRPILIQQDNAKPHLSPFDPDIVAAGTEGEWNIRLLFQPPNSPDMNCLDLGLFASLQVKQHREVVTGIEGKIESVKSAYMETDDVDQDNIFLTLQACMVCVLRDGGGNQYKIPHMSKAKQRREKKLPESEQR
ncbi:hypothetical protein PHPALM_31254 [Phytophthora palmivora]|uniref:Uncharacterized protein n=1 Tax=Phytophthora palmivora TaxID=4796 RepID=A0A2P4X320_9STRA|nr:hypothetical protein PHPALM_31254 [Phytophthora palmivora]